MMRLDGTLWHLSMHLEEEDVRGVWRECCECGSPLAPWRSVKPRCHTLGTAALAQGSEKLPSSSREPARGHRVTQETQQRAQTVSKTVVA